MNGDPPQAAPARATSTGRLEGRTALLVGGGSGIGRAVLDAFVAEGASVCVMEHDEAKCQALEEQVPGIAVVRGDARSAAEVRHAVGVASERFEGLDVLATFVGVFDLYTTLVDIPADRFDQAFDEVYGLNVKSVFHAVRAAAPELRARRGNVVVTCSSSSFFAGRGGALYVSSKFALRGAVVQLAHELAPEVRVNGVAPGGTVGTDLRGLRSLDQHHHRLDARPGREDALRARTPLGVALGPADHAAAYVFLAADGASGISGEVIRSDGGLVAR